jgi:hypothetical protein
MGTKRHSAFSLSHLIIMRTHLQICQVGAQKNRPRFNLRAGQLFFVWLVFASHAPDEPVARHGDCEL